uniref:Unspecific monooxygenase n=1 Tax=Panagrellus redivivus TaxID=6233 RepID=A0A7E4WCU8_PANRE
MGRGIMEDKIQYELGYFLTSLNEDLPSVTQNVIPKIEITVASIINQLLFGFAYHDEASIKEFVYIKDIITTHMQCATKPGTIFSFGHPILRRLPLVGKYYNELTDQYNIITGYVRDQVHKHLKNFDANSEPADYVDSYIAESKKKPGSYDETQLVNTCYDIFVAGQETTANTIIFSVLYAIHNPKAQEALHEELDRVIGSDRRIGLNDKARLPYTQAFINETQRLVNLLPLNLLHRTLKDTVVNGYQIPANTVIAPQISTALYDEEVFPKPKEFRPERFINADGSVKKIDDLVPFGVGKRQCLGESLARMELFIIIANMYNLYKFGPEKEGQLPSLEKINGVTIQPLPFSCKVTARY